MDSSFFLTVLAAVVGFFMLLGTTFCMVYRKFRPHQENITIASSLSCSSPPSSLSHNRKHHVFPSFHGADIRKTFLSHILKEFRSKGIDPFIDNDIERSKPIGPELIEAIRGSRIAIVLLSKNYASSTWCLTELVEIMNCREELGQTVITIFYEVDPTDVKKQTGDFGKVFRKTCKGKTKDDIGRWRRALAEVAKIAGYHSCNWDNDAAMIEKLTTDISNKLNNFTPSNDFNGLVGMGAHMEKMEQLLCLDLDDVRMIGIWGPSGIGKTTIARFLFNQRSDRFDLSVFMESIKASMYTWPACSDDYGLKLHLHQQLMSQVINQKDIEIPHLGVAQERLKDKKVFLVLDDVDRSVQLDAMAKESRWFGPGSRIIITTQDRSLLRAHGIKDIYKVDFPVSDEALQIFCMNAFGQSSCKDGFEGLACEVTRLAGELPLGLRVMGSYFRGMSKQEWTEAMPRLRTHLDSDIQSILNFSYEALDDEDRYLFLHIACFFNHERIELLEKCLEKNFSDVRHGIRVLAEKSLISTEWEFISMHNLLARLGKEIVRKQSIHDPGQRQFLIDAEDICEVLSDDTGSRNVLGIDLHSSGTENELIISEKAFKGLSNLQLLKVRNTLESLIAACNPSGDRRGDILHSQHGLNYLSRKLRILDWECYPMTCLPSNFCTEFLVKLCMHRSKLEKLWEGIQPLRILKWMDLKFSVNLKEVPDLSTAINLQELDLYGCSSLMELPASIGKAINLKKMNLTRCSSLVELPSTIGNAVNLIELVLTECSRLVKLPATIGNAINLQNLDIACCSSLVELPDSIGNATNLTTMNLSGCSSLVELPASIGNATNLTTMYLSGCSSLVELPSSIGKLHKLKKLTLRNCSKLENLPINIDMESLDELDLAGCSLLKFFPEISTNIKYLHIVGTAVEEVPSSIKSWSRLRELRMPYIENLKKFPHALDTITVLDLSNNTEIEEVAPWINRCSRLYLLALTGCRKLLSLPQLPDSLILLNAGNCESLERLDCSFNNQEIYLNFGNCFKLNQEARDLIIQTPTSKHTVLPCGKVPAYFSDRASGASVTVKLNERPLHTFLRFKACIVLVDKGEEFTGARKSGMTHMVIKQNGPVVTCRTGEFVLCPLVTEHLYTFEVEAEMTSSELVFEFEFEGDRWEIRECGILQLLEVPPVHEHDVDCENKVPRKSKDSKYAVFFNFPFYVNKNIKLSNWAMPRR